MNWPLDADHGPLITSDLQLTWLGAFRAATSSAAQQLRTCCVCSEDHNVSSMKVGSVSEIPNQYLLHTENMLPRLDLDDTDDTGMVAICGPCHSALTAKTPHAPPHSVFHNFFGGVIPDCLKGLTLPEMLMIAPIMCKVHVLKLVSYGKPDERQRCIKGNSIAFMQDVNSVTKILPDIDASCKYLKVCFVGDHSQPLPVEQLRKILRVRRDKVQAALEFLVENHVGFKELGITIDYTALASLPRNDVPTNIMENISRSTDTNAADRESTGYIPDTQAPLSDAVLSGDNISLARSCVVDIDSTLVDPEDFLIGASQHLLPNDDPCITIPHDPHPVSSYDNPSFWTLAFPTLFPYGTGGCDEKNIKLKAWATHLLNLHDKRFCTHYNFMFVVYSINNVRRVCSEANLSLERQFNDPDPVHSSDLRAAIENLGSDTAPRVPLVEKLWKQLKTVGSNIIGSNFHRGSLVYEIKALMMLYGLPNFFVTINPSDLDHPLVLHFAGHEVNLDRPFADGWVDKATRARLVAEDPVAVAKFFRTVITLWLSTIVGVKEKPPHSRGIFGRTKAHYGTVETQGRGSLHLHVLFWIHGAPTPEVLAEKLATTEFPPHLLAHLQNIIKEQFPDGEIVESVNDENKSCCSQRPPDPNDPDIGEILKNDLQNLVQKCQLHKHTDTCYKYGYKSCRFDFERAEVEIAKIENGVVWLQRKKGNGWVNNYNDIILLALRCNHDVKYISNGRDSKALAFYITSYITKNALTTHNAFPIMMAAADGIEGGIHRCAPNPVLTPSQQLNRELVIKCVNKLTTHAERSGPEIATMLLGYPLHYTDHSFEKLYISPFLSFFDSKTAEVVERFSIAITGDTYQLVNQKLCYLSKPDTFSTLSLYDFVRWFYKAKIPKKGIPPNSFLFHDSHPQHKTHYMQRRTQSQPMVPVIVGSWFPTKEKNPELYAKLFMILFKPFTKLEDLRPLPTVSWSDALDAWDWQVLPPETKDDLMRYRNNIDAMNSGLDQQKLEQEERHKLRQDQGLTDTDQRSFEDPFDEMFAPVGEDLLDAPDISLPHPVINTTLGCFALTAISHLSMYGGLNQEGVTAHPPDGTPVVDVENSFVFPNHVLHPQWVQENLSKSLKKQVKTQKGEAKETDLGQTKEDRAIDQLLSDRHHPRTTFDVVMLEIISAGFTLNPKQHMVFMKIGHTLLEVYNMDQANPNTPIPKQILAYIGGPGGTGKSRIITAVQNLFHRIGKKKWLRTTAFTGSASSNVNGSTLSSILKDCKKSKKSLTVAINRVASLVKEVGTVRFLIIDEVSMISCNLLSKLDARLKQTASTANYTKPFGGIHLIFFGDFIQYPCVKGTCLYELLEKEKNRTSSDSDEDEKKEHSDPEEEFSDDDTNINNTTTTDISHTTGRSLWCLLNYSLFLTEQMRCTDPVFHTLLTDLRNKSTKMIKTHAKLIAARTLGSATADADANCDEFANAPIITTRNAVRVAINFEKAKVHSAALGEKMVVVLARDSGSAKAGLIDLPTRKRLLHLLDNKTDHLPGMLPLVPNMPLVIKTNIATELGICNGTRCFFSRMILHAEEPVVDLASSVGVRNVHFVKKIPEAIIVKVPNPKFRKFEGLGEETITDSKRNKVLYREFPIFPAKVSFTHTVRSNGTNADISINRSQFPLVPGYAITGYTAQGQTYGQAIIDLRVPEGPHCGPSNKADLYVLLSRMKTRKGLLVLRPFQPAVLKQRPRPSIFLEIDRLKALARDSALVLPPRALVQRTRDTILQSSTTSTNTSSSSSTSTSTSSSSSSTG
jgi:hypothetical protein